MNAASSRAIPASIMIADIEEDPFIPVAFQKAHSGMQGTEYFEDTKDIVEDWLEGRDEALRIAEGMVEAHGLTKQLVNRILEPYQWYTSIVTATEYDNFFELRCPQYEVSCFGPDRPNRIFKSKRDARIFAAARDGVELPSTNLDWLKLNKGQGEIHISLLAEAMWDARNDSEPKQLEEGEWHVPFGDKIDANRILELPDLMLSTSKEEEVSLFNTNKIKIATARCARISYNNFEGKDDYEADIKLHDRLLQSGHYSPFEHCARAMNEIEYEAHIRSGIMNSEPTIQKGWSGNFKGFVQLRKEIE